MKLRSTLAAHHRRQLLVLAAAMRLADAAGDKLQAGRIDVPLADGWALEVAAKYEARARRPAGFLALLGSVALLQLLLAIVVPVVRILARAASDPSNEGAAAPENLPR